LGDLIRSSRCLQPFTLAARVPIGRRQAGFRRGSAASAAPPYPVSRAQSLQGCAAVGIEPDDPSSMVSHCCRFPATSCKTGDRAPLCRHRQTAVVRAHAHYRQHYCLAWPAPQARCQLVSGAIDRAVRTNLRPSETIHTWNARVPLVAQLSDRSRGNSAVTV
jgi:hypothetical protein